MTDKKIILILNIKFYDTPKEFLMKKILPLLGLIAAGIATAFLRFNAAGNNINTDTGIIENTAALYSLFGVMIGAVAVLLVVILIKRRTLAIDFEQKGSTLYKTASVVGAMLFIAAGGAAFFAVSAEGASVITIITAIFSLVCGVCLFFEVKTRNNPEISALLSVVPIFFAAFQLLMFYRGNNSNPLIYSFATELFALIFAMFALYSISGCSFGKNRPALVAFSSAGAVYLLTTVLLSDNFLPELTRGHLHFSLSEILILAAFLLCAVRNLLCVSTKSNIQSIEK